MSTVVRRISVVLLVAICFTPNSRAAELESSKRESRPGWYMGRQIAPTMSASGADWLIRKSREKEEQPKLLLGALKLKKGQTVCDFGCGNGYYSIELAHRVGPRGRVLAVDIQQEMLDLLTERAQSRGITNIEPVLATEADPGLRPNSVDLVLMVDVYHELFEPEPVLKAMHRSLKRDGLLVLVEFREEDPNVPIRPLHKMSQPQVLKELAANKFKLVRQFDELPWQHVLFFATERSSIPGRKLVPWRPKTPDIHTAPVSHPQSPVGKQLSPPSGDP